MTYQELELPGVLVLEPERKVDERGFFARVYDGEELAARGSPLPISQASVSFNTMRGTLRGLHLQRAPHAEIKLVRCLSGRVFDVVVDLRAGSPTALRWAAVELTAERRNALYIPEGVAHGFLTLEDGCELEYLISVPYEPSAAVGVRWDDPVVGVAWPFPPAVISARDAAFPDLDAASVRARGPAALEVAA
jgi:dTDP-4-dehydrorhamnose 3,5-epimerase